MSIHHHTLQTTKEKYFKFKQRLEKNISSGTFQKLSRKKKNRLISRVEKFRSRLEGLTRVKKGALVAGSIGAAMLPNTLSAQDPLMRFERGTMDMAVFGTNVQVKIVNIDSDPELEMLISTTSDGFIVEGNDQDGYDVIRPTELDQMRSEFFVGDVDGDGDNDIIYRNSDFFYLLFNDGDGNFEITEQEYYYSTGNTPGAIARETSSHDVDLVDFDSDGDLDLLIAYDNNDLKHFENNGSGYFSTAGYLTAGTENGVTDFEFADMDNDGDLDLIHNFYDGQDNTRVYLKENTAGPNATPTFSGASTYLAYYNYAGFEHMSALDIDGDNDLDIFFTDPAYNQSFVFQNRYDEGMDFQFNSIPTSGLPNEDIRDVAISDFDGDGDDDLLMSFVSDSKIGVFDGTNFNATNRSLNNEIGNAARAFSSIAVGDIDEDGLDDIVGLTTSIDPFVYFDRSAPYISDINGDVIIDENNPAGVIATLTVDDFHSDPITSSLTGADASLFTWNDGTGELSTNQSFDWEETGSELDLGISFDDGNKTRVEKINIRINNLPEEGQGYFDPNALTLVSSIGFIERITSGDIDQDGDEDLFVTDETILVNNGVTFLSERVNVFSSGATEVAFIDFDDDGDLDLFGLDNSGLYGVTNTGEGSWNSIGTNFIGDGSSDFITGDFDSDGLEEVALIRRPSFGSDYTYFRRFEVDINNTSFREDQNISLQPSAGGGAMQNAGRIVDIDIADFDGDGNLDLLVIAENDGTDPGTDAFFMGTGTGFSDTSTATTGFNADNGFNRIEVGDLEGNGSIDIATLRYDGSEVDVDIMLNNGSGVFTVSQSLNLAGEIDPTGADELSDIVLGDMDGDGSLDIVTSATDASGQSDVTLWLNDGSGTFSQQQTISNVNGVEMNLMDIDNDDDLDLVLLVDRTSRDELKVYLNTNVPASSIDLSASALDEHLPLDTEVATISVTDTNPNDMHTILLADGDGTNDEHNNFFAINGNSLLITRDISSEDFPSLNILLAVSDGENTYEQSFSFTVNQVNLAPTALDLSPDNFDEGTAIGSAISTLSATDDGVEEVSFELAVGDGTNDADNGSFRIEGDQLIIEDETRFETKATYSIYVRAYDIDGSVEQALVVNVNDVNQAPTALGLSSTSINEDVIPGTAIANIQVTDPNAGDSHAFSLVDGTGSDDNDKFIVQGSQLLLIQTLEFNTDPTLNIRLSASDGEETFEEAFTLTVNEVLGLDDELRNVLGIYPNPGNSSIQFNIENDLFGEMNIQVLDFSGRTIRQFTSQKINRSWSYDLDMSSEEAGVYIVEVQVGPVNMAQRWIKKD